MWEYGLNSTSWGYEPAAGSCEHSYESLGYIRQGINLAAYWLSASQDGLFPPLSS